VRLSGFLLDVHVPLSVADGVRAARAGCRVEHVAHWRGGKFREDIDGPILEAAVAERLAVVTYDVNTIPAILHRWLADGRSIPPVVLISARSGSPARGAVIRALVELYDDPSPFESDYPIVHRSLR